MDGELCPDQLKMTHEASILKTQNPFKQHTYKEHIVSCLQSEAGFVKVRNDALVDTFAENGAKLIEQ